MTKLPEKQVKLLEENKNRLEQILLEEAKKQLKDVCERKGNQEFYSTGLDMSTSNGIIKLVSAMEQLPDKTQQDNTMMGMNSFDNDESDSF